MVGYEVGNPWKHNKKLCQNHPALLYLNLRWLLYLMYTIKVSNTCSINQQNIPRFWRQNQLQAARGGEYTRPAQYGDNNEVVSRQDRCEGVAGLVVRTRVLGHPRCYPLLLYSILRCSTTHRLTLPPRLRNKLVSTNLVFSKPLQALCCLVWLFSHIRRLAAKHAGHNAGKQQTFDFMLVLLKM